MPEDMLSDKELQKKEYKEETSGLTTLTIGEVVLKTIIERYGCPCSIPAKEGVWHVCRILHLERPLVCRLMRELDMLGLIEFTNTGRSPSIVIHTQLTGLLEGKVIK